MEPLHDKRFTLLQQSDWIPIAPSGRYLHSTVVYQTWTHEDAYLNMCAGDTTGCPGMKHVYPLVVWRTVELVVGQSMSGEGGREKL